jgi:response regulator NasT
MMDMRSQLAPLEAFVQRTQNGGMKDRALHILVIDTNRIRASIIEEGLSEAGQRRVTVLDDTTGVMRRIVELDPDVIVIDLESPNRDALEHMFQVSRAAKRPVAMFVDRTDDASIEAAIDAGVSAYVVDGLRKERIKPILDTAISRFRAFERLRQELDEARSELSERKKIERAKGILMRTRRLSEQDAYGLLRSTAMKQNRRIAEIADSLITAAGLLGEEDGI